MVTISEDYVSFEIAKLLKEKGFDEECLRFYMPNGYGVWKYEHYHDFDISDRIECPTLQMAMKWLREVHNIFIDICTLSPLVYIYRVCLISDTTGYFYEDYACEEGERFMSYKEAVEFALDYCLNNILEV